MNLDADIIPIIIIVIFLIFRVMVPMIRRTLRVQLKGTKPPKLISMMSRAKNAMLAKATITNIAKVPSPQDRRKGVKVDLRLEVEPSIGEPYTVQTSWRMEQNLLAQYQPGQTISVKVDLDDPDLVFPTEPGMKYWD